jgi:hypothetical protein
LVLWIGRIGERGGVHASVSSSGASGARRRSRGDQVLASGRCKFWSLLISTLDTHLKACEAIFFLCAKILYALFYFLEKTVM